MEAESFKIPSQFANKDGGFNVWGLAIVALTVGVMTFQIIDFIKDWKIQKLEKAQEDEISDMKIQLAELKTLHQNQMPSQQEHSFINEMPKPTAPLVKMPRYSRLQGFLN
jgi:hypothetical protein